MLVPGFISWVTFNRVLAMAGSQWLFAEGWMDISLLTVLRVSVQAFPPPFLDLLGSVFTYFTFWGDWREEKSVLCSCLLCVCGITSAERWHLLILSQAFRLTMRSFCQYAVSFKLSWPLFCSPSLGHWGGLGGRTGSPAFILVHVVPVYPTVIVFGGRTLTWLVSFPGKMIPLMLWKWTFPRHPFGNFLRFGGSVQVTCLLWTFRPGCRTLCTNESQSLSVLWDFCQ